MTFIKRGDSPHRMIYLMGGGPGDPELLTIKAVRALSESDVVLYDELVNPEILSHCGKQAEQILVGKHKGHHRYTQDEINSLTARLALEYPVITRLKGGDPMVFGRGGEEYEFLVSRGFHCQIIPGITAACAVAASVGQPLTHRDYASELIFLSGHSKTGAEDADFSRLQLKGKTHVIYMGLSKLPHIMAELIQSNTGFSNIPVLVVESATRKDQRVHVATVATIEQEIKDKKLSSPALIIIGEIVSYFNKLNNIRRKLELDSLIQTTTQLTTGQKSAVSR